jgi:hypothetical protein
LKKVAISANFAKVIHDQHEKARRNTGLCRVVAGGIVGFVFSGVTTFRPGDEL